MVPHWPAWHVPHEHEEFVWLQVNDPPHPLSITVPHVLPAQAAAGSRG
jgi:hypothetical protein